MARDYSINKAIHDFIQENDKKAGAIADKAGIRRDTFSRIVNSQRVIFADELLPILNAAGMPLDRAMAALENGKTDEGGA